MSGDEGREVSAEPKTKPPAASSSEDTDSSEGSSDSSSSSPSQKEGGSGNSDSSSSSSSESDSDSDDELLASTNVAKKKPARSSKPATASTTGLKARVKKELAGGSNKRTLSASSKDERPKKLVKTKNEVGRKARACKEEAAGEEDDDGSKYISMGVLKNRTPKQMLVAQFLKRWWYALSPWPPEDFDYHKALAERKFKWISLEEWEDAEDVDKDGFVKVYQISAFPGIFRQPNGEALDLRPKENCPSYSNFMAKSDLELLQLISKAIEKQLEELKKSPYDETVTRKNLLKELAEVNRDLQKKQQREEYLRKRKMKVKNQQEVVSPSS